MTIYERAIATHAEQKHILSENREAKTVKTRETRAQWQAMADAKWAKNPQLSASRVAERIVEELEASGVAAKADTVRRAIRRATKKKVGKAVQR